MDSKASQSIRHCLSSLDQTERYVVLLFFADELTPAEIGLVLDVSQLRVADILESFRLMVAKLMGMAGEVLESKALQNFWVRPAQHDVTDH